MADPPCIPCAPGDIDDLAEAIERRRSGKTSNGLRGHWGAIIAFLVALAGAALLFGNVQSEVGALERLLAQQAVAHGKQIDSLERLLAKQAMLQSEAILALERLLSTHADMDAHQGQARTTTRFASDIGSMKTQLEQIMRILRDKEG